MPNLTFPGTFGLNLITFLKYPNDSLYSPIAKYTYAVPINGNTVLTLSSGNIFPKDVL